MTRLEIELWALLAITCAIILFAFTGCKPLEIKDSEWCGDMGPDGAICFHTLVPDMRIVPKAQWDIEREGQVCTKGSVFADQKALIEKLCHETNGCAYEQVTKFFDKAEA